MLVNILDSVASAASSPVVSGLQSSARAAIAAATRPESEKTVINTVTLTSVTGATTTVVTYSDGSSKTTVSDGDAVVLTSKTSGKSLATA